ncbi:hypothetical protein [Jannaschia sp. 2305UL9-9]|uniref:hypothetical protein n=1 Tax=Jannaschia sp. 2305UL9-9 TaxID=3121638 RepID=UPI00352940DB
MTADIATYLKRHTEALVKDVGVAAACEITGKSKATIGRYYATHEEHAERFMPIDAVALLEAEASYPHVTVALTELHTVTRSRAAAVADAAGGIGHDVAVLSQRFAHLMGAYAEAMETSAITPGEAKQLLQETLELQKVLVDMKVRLQIEAVEG